MARSDDLKCKTEAPQGKKPNDVLFGADTPNEAIKFLQPDDAIRVSVFGLPDGESISVFEIDKSTGSECADTGTGAEFPYDPCCDGVGKEYTKAGTYYIKGAGAFKFVYSGISGTASVKYTIVKNSSVTEKMACPVCKCYDTTWTWTGSEVCDGENVMREEVSNCGTKRLVLNRPTTWTATGVTECGTDFIQVQQSNDCGKLRWIDGSPISWVETGKSKCESHVTVIEEVNNCGTTRWTTTTEVCGYSPSVPFVIEVFDGCCGSNQVGYMYHPDEDRDPSATVAVEDCDGVVWGYIYPTVATGRTLPVGGCGETPIGYAVNQSTTAPSFAQCGGDIIVNVPKTTVENTVNVEPTPIEVIVPEPPRSVLSVGWSGDNLLLTYSDGSNQTISTPVC